ncbi:ficolin-1-like [Zeugodacus cucurbitae]|uniref:ficolin-1-like n=1 Tax=Zeugodacus cucurbitae TaxID=28588 RepID=UPI0023D9347A|nr:ficolin-1-like [Zeugodacus cucurbitae]
MFRFTSFIVLNCILIFQIGFGLQQDADTSTVCDCNCDVQIDVVSKILKELENVRKFTEECSNNEKLLRANRAIKPYSFMEVNNLKSGVYRIDLPKINVTNLEVFYEEDMDIGGWLVIQRRQNGSVDFTRNWHHYKKGFGDLMGNYWIGLETLYALTSGCEQELYIQMKARNGTEYYAKYSHILIGNEGEDYVLKKLGKYSGSAGDSLSYHLGMKFSSYDRDNDKSNTRNCAQTYYGGWWFNDCYRGHFNGRFEHSLGGLNWHDIEKDVSLVFAQMMIRPNQNCWRKLMLRNAYQQD